MKYTKEQNKALFIHSLKDLAKKEGVYHLSFFLRFFAENIKSRSGKVRMAVIILGKNLFSSLPQPLESEKEKEFCQFVDRIIDMMEDYYKEDFCKYDRISDLPPSVYKSLQMLVSKVLLSEEYYRNIYEKHLQSIPSFMECTWKRVNCGRDNCPLCAGRENFIDLPYVEEFVHTAVKNWCENLFYISEEAEEEGDFWMFTRAACDLFWYSSQLSMKCSVLAQSEALTFENNYARYVIRECLKIIKSSLKEIVSHSPHKKEELERSLYDLQEVEKSILDL